MKFLWTFNPAGEAHVACRDFEACSWILLQLSTNSTFPSLACFLSLIYSNKTPRVTSFLNHIAFSSYQPSYNRSVYNSMSSCYLVKLYITSSNTFSKAECISYFRVPLSKCGLSNYPCIERTACILRMEYSLIRLLA